MNDREAFSMFVGFCLAAGHSVSQSFEMAEQCLKKYRERFPRDEDPYPSGS